MSAVRTSRTPFATRGIPRGIIARVVDPDVKPVVLEDGAVHFDARCFPIVFITWFGVISEPGVRIYSEWIDRMASRAAEGSTRMFLIEDISECELPTPEVRQVLGRTLKALSDRHGKLYLGGSMILPSAFMRAAFTIVKMLSGNTLDYKAVKGLEDAMARAYAMLDAAGLARPERLDLASYRRPARPTG